MFDIPWGDESRWDDIRIDGFQSDPDTGGNPSGTIALYNVPDGEIFHDRSGHAFTKCADGSVQGAVVVTDGEVFAQWDGSTLVKYALVTDELIEAVREAGIRAARNAATWIADGTTPTDSIRGMLQGIDECDPVTMDALDALRPNLSGEWADDLTPVGLAVDILDMDGCDIPHDDIDTIADAWTQGVDDTFVEACETKLRKQLGD